MNADNEVTHTEVKFYPEVKSQTGLSSLRVLCKRALSNTFFDNMLLITFSAIATLNDRF